MQSIYAQDTNSLIMGEVIKLFSSSERVCYQSILSTLFTKIPKIVFFVLAKKCIESSTVIFEPLINAIKATLFTLFYTKKKYSSSVTYPESHTVACIKEQEFPVFPIYTSAEETTGDTIVSYIPLIHSYSLSVYESQGTQQYNVYLAKKKQVKSKLYIQYEQQGRIASSVRDYHNLFPSRNYKELSACIKKYFEVSQRTGTANVLGILIDGVPGLGKTKFVDYAAAVDLAPEIHKVDATKFLSMPANTLLKLSYHNLKITTPTIVLIDELDKYLDQRVQIEYRNQSKDDKIEEQEFVSYTKQQYLYELLSVLERDDISSPIVVIFCSNNFKSIFEGVDTTHFKSLYDRFFKFTFVKCDHAELVEYMHHYDTDYCKDEISRKLKRDVKITYRSLQHLSIRAMYDTEKMIELLNDYEKEELVSSSRRVDLAIGDEGSNSVQAIKHVIGNGGSNSVQAIKHVSETNNNLSSSRLDQLKGVNQPSIPPTRNKKNYRSVKYIEDIDYDFLTETKDYVELLPEHLQVWSKDYIMSDYNAIVYPGMGEDKDGARRVERGIKAYKDSQESINTNNKYTIYSHIKTVCTSLDIKAAFVAAHCISQGFRLFIEPLYTAENEPLYFAPADVKKMCYCITGKKVD